MLRFWEKCRLKTEKGNRYTRWRRAVQAAASMTRETGVKIVAFRCRLCCCYHLGSFDQHRAVRYKGRKSAAYSS